jgi:hypothetical protein
MAENPIIKHPGSRITYIEPNDVYGQVNGIPVTPDYTDFCISFDLIVEVISRTRANEISKENYKKYLKGDTTENDAKKTYVFSWTSKYNPNGDEKVEKNETPNVVSFMTGVEYEKNKRFLTTYYTEGHYNDIKKGTIVEGLGVESVNISFESYYTPTVKMRFIDVRGASIFGREEFTHIDEVLSEDNIWGCFFTFPYPKYKLQVKGFYGRAVTFQLCCTDFRANFNPQTGNFEIDMTFLGYDFGLLADVPMQYLIAAPYSKYADTQAYWLKQSSTNDNWKMSNGMDPITFKEIIDKIKFAIDLYGENGGKTEVSTDEVEREIVDIEKIGMLDEMEPYINNIKDYMADYTGKYVKQLEAYGVKFSLIHNSRVYPFEVVLLSNGFKQDYDIYVDDKIAKTARDNEGALFKLINEYNEKWPEGGFEKIEECYNTRFEKNKTGIGRPYYEIPVKDTLPLSQYHVHFTDNDDTTIKLNKLFNFYSDAKEKAKSIVSETVTRQPESVEKKTNITELVGFIPNIGNVFRTLFCHLETFAHMIYTCAGNVYSQMKENQRTLDKLGIPSWENTDIDPRKIDEPKQVVPFPGIYTFKKVDGNEENGQEEDDELQTNVWIGDLRKNTNANPWEEEIMIENLLKAVLYTKSDMESNSSNFSSTKFPVLPCDINSSGTAGISLGETPGDLAGYLALRAIALFEIADYNNDEAEQAGVADAIQYYESWGVKDKIKEKILKGLGNGNKTDALINMMMCSGELAVNTLSFEVAENTVKKNPSRHPILAQGNGFLSYIYCMNKDGVGMIPIRLNAWGALKDNFVYHASKDPGKSYYNFKLFGNRSNILYDVYSEDLIKTVENPPDNIDYHYSNDEIFNAYYGGEYGDGSQIVEKIEEMYNNLKDGAISLQGYTEESDEKRFDKLLKNHWRNITTEQYESAYTLNVPLKLYPNYSEFGITDDNMFNKETGDIKELVDFRHKGFKRVVKTKDGYFLNEKQISDDSLLPLELSINVFKDNNEVKTEDVFTSRIYNLQNDATSVYTNKPAFEFDTREHAPDKAKAIIFLSSLYYLKAIKLAPFQKNEDQTSIIERVPLVYLLYLGGLLWRKYFYEKNGFDPIITGDVYKEMKIDEVPFFNLNGTYYKGYIEKGAHGGYENWSDTFGTDMDIILRNKLISIFEDFVKSDEWNTIKEYCELKDKDGLPLTYDGIKKVIDGYKTPVQTAKNNLHSSYMKNYSLIHGIVSFFREDNPALPVIKKIYLSSAIVQKTVSRFWRYTTDNGTDSISEDSLRKYVNGFVKQLEKIVNSEDITKIESENESDSNNHNEDIKRLMYEFIKNIWDRWFVGTPETLYSCERYMANTMFIDSMYRNVYEKIHINCEILLDLLTDVDGKSMVFKFLSDITTKHHCMFFALPDYLNLNKDNQNDIENAITDAFRPIPFSQINPIESMNKYIVMFTHKPSEVNATTNSYTYDSFDIYSHDEQKDYILPTFTKPAMDLSEDASEHDKQCKRYGYNLPAFGVEFGRQNNAIFKRVNIGMQNPIQTEQSIEALSLIAERGRGATQRNIFYGQDLYSVYSGYSYTATLEMMGNAQIMPLMYFQLFNIPMFRGAYMIYSVTHTMKPGDMTTTVKAMKMSKRTLPWCQEWYGHYYFHSDGTIDFVRDDECGAIDCDCKSLGNTDYHVSYNGHEKEISPIQNIRHMYDSKEQTLCASLKTTIKVNIRLVGGKTKEVSLTVNKYIADKFKEIFKCIFNGTYKNGGDAKINGKYFEFTSDVIGAYDYRKVKNPKKPESNSLSNHSYGVAVDINPDKNPFSCTKALKISNTDTETCIRTFNHPVVKIFKEFGFGWGGRYNDFMHFSYFDGR